MIEIIITDRELLNENNLIKMEIITHKSEWEEIERLLENENVIIKYDLS